MKLIYFLEDVSIAVGTIALTIAVSAVLLPLELTGLWVPKQDYVQKGRFQWPKE